MNIRMNRGIKMKIRHGFVSNSSSTSFTIYGFEMSETDIINTLEEGGFITDEVIAGFEDVENVDDILEKYGPEELFEDVIEKSLDESFKGLEIQWLSYEEIAYVGFDYRNVPDNMTMGEWKKEKGKILEKIFGPERMSHDKRIIL